MADSLVEPDGERNTTVSAAVVTMILIPQRYAATTSSRLKSYP